MTITGFEIDFLPVGKKSKSGDAILFRYKEDGKFKVILIDGGHKESEGVKTSNTILDHMKKYYENMRIDHIICSHPDSDHVGGLQEVMKECNVGTLWINNPIDYVDYDDLSDEHNNDSFCKSDADTVKNLIDTAKEKEIDVNSPLQGKQIGVLCVASPSKEFYKKLVMGNLQRQGNEQASSKTTLLGKIIRRWIRAVWNEDRLKKYPATSVCNESSTVLYGNFFDNKKFLLTADAGIEALSRTHTYLQQQVNFESGSLTFIQMPHHGGRHNVNVDVLNKILGQKITEFSDENRGFSVASVAEEAEEYPKKAVMHAFVTRGYDCFSTKGKFLYYSTDDMPGRPDFSPAIPLEHPLELEDFD